MIKLKKYNNKQIEIINDYTQMHLLIENAFIIRNSDVPSISKNTDLLKILLSYMALRKQQLLDIGIDKKDADYIVKQELKRLNLVLKEFKNAIPKNS